MKSKWKVRYRDPASKELTEVTLDADSRVEVFSKMRQQHLEPISAELVEVGRPGSAAASKLKEFFFVLLILAVLVVSGWWALGKFAPDLRAEVEYRLGIGEKSATRSGQAEAAAQAAAIDRESNPNRPSASTGGGGVMISPARTVGAAKDAANAVKAAHRDLDGLGDADTMNGPKRVQGRRKSNIYKTRRLGE